MGLGYPMHSLWSHPPLERSVEDQLLKNSNDTSVKVDLTLGRFSFSAL